MEMWQAYSKGGNRAKLKGLKGKEGLLGAIPLGFRRRFARSHDAKPTPKPRRGEEQPRRSEGSVSYAPGLWVSLTGQVRWHR